MFSLTPILTFWPGGRPAAGGVHPVELDISPSADTHLMDELDRIIPMLVVLGPVDSREVCGWIRFARRVICELRHDPGDLHGVVTPDMLTGWSRMIDQWEKQAAVGPDFKWTEILESEQAEYLLHGFERCLQSRSVRRASTTIERSAQRRFSMHIMQAFVDGLSEEGHSSQHYADQVQTSFGALLDH